MVPEDKISNQPTAAVTAGGTIFLLTVRYGLEL
jgi:hypothetical protein